MSFFILYYEIKYFAIKKINQDWRYPEQTPLSCCSQGLTSVAHDSPSWGILVILPEHSNYLLYSSVESIKTEQLSNWAQSLTHKQIVIYMISRDSLIGIEQLRALKSCEMFPHICTRTHTCRTTVRIWIISCQCNRADKKLITLNLA